MSGHRARPNDAGMTLIELVVVVVLIGLLTGAVSGAIIVVFRSQNGVVATTAESHDTQQIVSYLPLDVQSGPSRADAYRAAIGGAGGDRGTGCSELGNGNLLRIDVTDRRLDLADKRIAYQLSDDAAGRRIDRHLCGWDEVALTWVVETSTNVVDLLDRDVALSDAAVAEVFVAADLPSPADEQVVAVELRYVQRGDTETVRAAPREEQRLSTSGVCGADPLAAARDIDSFVETDVHLDGTAVKSRLFVGRNLSFAGSVEVAQTGGLPPVAVPDPYTDLGLLAGVVDWGNSTGTITVKQGADVLIEDGQYVSDPDGPISAPPETSSSATIDLQGGAVRAPGADRLVAPGSAFLELRSCSDRLAGLPDSCDNEGCAAHAELPGYDGTAAATEDPRLTLQSDVTNVLNIDESNLAQLQAFTIDFAPGDNIGQTTPLVINVASGPMVAFEAPDVQGSGTNTVYLIWNFPNADQVHLLSGNELRGTLMAPYAAVEAWASIDGGVIARQFTMHGPSLSTHRSFEGVLGW